MQSCVVNHSEATYQWVDRNANFFAILGETNQRYSAVASGDYAVEIPQNGCMETSACFSVTFLGIIASDFGNDFTAYTNPTNKKVIID